jgi:hypothetical protein
MGNAFFYKYDELSTCYSTKCLLVMMAELQSSLIFVEPDAELQTSGAEHRNIFIHN